jgi:hypothetical protein
VQDQDKVTQSRAAWRRTSSDPEWPPKESAGLRQSCWPGKHFRLGCDRKTETEIISYQKTDRSWFNVKWIFQKIYIFFRIACLDTDHAWASSKWWTYHWW